MGTWDEDVDGDDDDSGYNDDSDENFDNHNKVQTLPYSGSL